ncbi:MAG: RDD family protein [Verrucomicrobiota bacterium]
MGEWFYTDKESNQQGPFNEATLLSLSREGTILGSTLVWEDGMESWDRWADLASSFYPRDDEGEKIKLGVCAQSDRVFPLDEMLPYGEALIAAEEKAPFIQKLLERGTTGIEDATEKREEYIGFWWRVLSSFLDYLIKMVPTWICMIPHYAVILSGGLENLETDPDSGTIIALAVSNGVGMIGILFMSIFYETWMVSKYGGTLGKSIIGAKVIRPDGSKLTYKQAFLRWLAKKPLNYTIFWLPVAIGVGLLVTSTMAAASEATGGATLSAAIVAGLVGCAVFSILGSGVYWMAAFDPEKRALHDRVASTRVVRK